MVLAGALAISGCSGIDDGDSNAGQAAVEVPAYSIEDFMEIVTYRGLSFSPDGKTIMTTGNASGVANLVAMPVDGGESKELTDSNEPLHLIGFFPNDGRILFSADMGGNGQNHLYVRETSGKMFDLTPGEGIRTRFANWSGDGMHLYVHKNSPENRRRFDLYSISADNYETTLVFKNEKREQIGQISPDGRHALLWKGIDNSTAHIELLDLATGETTPITAKISRVMNLSLGFSPDMKYVYYLTDKWSEMTYLMRYDLDTGRHEEVVKRDWDLTSFYSSSNFVFSPDGARFVVTVNRDSRLELEVYDAATLQLIGGTASPEASVASHALSRDGRYLATIVENGQTPGDVLIQQIGNQEVRRLTNSLNRNITRDHLVAGEVVRFNSYDGLAVPGILYKPHNASAVEKAAAIVFVHGGPGLQAHIGYRDLFQYLVNHGYTVFDINNRGSAGYGKTFSHLDDHAHGDRDLKDVIAARDFLVGLGYVDPNAVAVMGESYGGYLALAAATFYPETFDAVVDIYGVSNWIRTQAMFAARSISVAVSAYRTSEFGDLADEAHWRKVSPLFHAERIARPLLVLQGLNDPVVVAAESSEIVEKARANGADVEYVTFDDEGHGFYKKKNQVRAYTAILNFLNKHLRGT